MMLAVLRERAVKPAMDPNVLGTRISFTSVPALSSENITVGPQPGTRVSGASLMVIVRDGVLLAAGAVLMVRWHARIDVRWIGKVATFALMCGIPLVAWGSFGLALAATALALGWVAFSVGIVEYYVATVLYLQDFVAALRAPVAGA